MKKITLLLSALLLIFALAACGDGELPPRESLYVEDSSEEVLASGENFTVTKKTDDGSVKYSYTVTANDGAVLESALCAEMPRVALCSDTVVGIRFSAGERAFCRYYDVANGRISGSFANAFWDNGELVAYHQYTNGHHMLVEDIFDENGYRYDLDLECNLLHITVTETSLSEDGSALTVKYITGDDAEADLPTVTVSLPLAAADVAD